MSEGDVKKIARGLGISWLELMLEKPVRKILNYTMTENVF